MQLILCFCHESAFCAIKPEDSAAFSRWVTQQASLCPCICVASPVALSTLPAVPDSHVAFHSAIALEFSLLFQFLNSYHTILQSCFLTGIMFYKTCCWASWFIIILKRVQKIYTRQIKNREDKHSSCLFFHPSCIFFSTNVCFYYYFNIFIPKSSSTPS